MMINIIGSLVVAYFATGIIFGCFMVLMMYIGVKIDKEHVDELMENGLFSQVSEDDLKKVMLFGFIPICRENALILTAMYGFKECVLKWPKELYRLCTRKGKKK